MFFGQVASSSLGSVIILYVILTVNFPFNSILTIWYLSFEMNCNRFAHNFLSTCALTQLHYLPVYGLLFGLMFQIFTACLLGNFVELTVCYQFNYFVCLLCNSLNALLLHASMAMYEFFIWFCFTFSTIKFTRPHCLWISMSYQGTSNDCIDISSRAVRNLHYWPLADWPLWI